MNDLAHEKNECQDKEDKEKRIGNFLEDVSIDNLKHNRRWATKSLFDDKDSNMDLKRFVKKKIEHAASWCIEAWGENDCASLASISFLDRTLQIC